MGPLGRRENIFPSGAPTGIIRAILSRREYSRVTGRNMTSVPHLLHVFSGFGIGGAEVRTATLMNELGPRYRHSILSLNGDLQCMERLSSDLDVKVIAPPDLSGTLFNRLSKIRGLLKSVAPDVLMTRNWGTIEFALANRFLRICRHIHHEEGFNHDESLRQIPRRVWTRRFAFGGVDAVFTPSEHLAEIARKIWWTPQRKIAYFPNGIQCAPFQITPEADAIPGFQRKNGEIIVGTVAAIRKVKNLSRLVRVFAEASQGLSARLVIVGAGDDLENVRAEAARCDIAEQVITPGYMSDPSKFMGLFDVFALSSDSEQMPLSVVEAMASGLAVAATDVGDVKNMLAPVNQPFVAPLDDETKFADQLQTLLTDSELRQQLGAENRKKALLEFTAAKMAETNDGLVKSILNKR
jgi:L-malate glycosyltransferase